MKKGTGLRYTPIQDVNLIPPYLLDQVEPKEWATEKLYQFGEMITNNPLSILGVFSNKEHLIKGVLWGTVNPLTEKIFIHILSIDQEYQGRGIVKETTAILKKIQDKHNLKSIRFYTNQPEKFESAGYEKTGDMAMELKNG